MIYDINHYLVDTGRYQIERNGRAIAVEPATFDLLVFLIENSERVVTRTELLEALWKDQIVTDSALTARLKGARKALGDSGKRQSIIKTVHGRGYQFIGKIHLDSQNPEEPLTETAEIAQPLPLPDIPSIAVLPFVNISKRPEQDYFSDGLSRDIITQLSRFQDLFVIASHSSFAYKDTSVNIQQAGTELGVRYILEGSVQTSNDRLRISVQLIDSKSGQHLWADAYDREISDIFKVQDEVTEIIVGTLASTYGGRLRKAWQKQNAIAKPRSHQAFDYFMRAVDAVDRFTRQDNARGRGYLEKAVELDPNYAKAFAKMSWTYILDNTEGWSDDDTGSMKTAKALATRAISLDDNESWGHWALAACHTYSREYEVAFARFDRTIEINPNDADALADYGYYLAYVGRAEKGITVMRKAMRLNPYFPDWYTAEFVQILYDARAYQAAIKQFQRLREGEWIVARLYVAASHAALGETQEATEVIASILQLDSKSSIEKWTHTSRAPYQAAEDLEHFRANLARAGLPERV